MIVNKKLKLAIILPAHNEEKVLGDVLELLPKKLPGIENIYTIVTDDGSSDNTFSVAKKYADYALRHKINLGAGSATLTGIKFAKLKLKPDIYVTLDSDGQHDPRDISNLIKPIVDRRVAITIGSRMLNAKGMPTIKKVTNKMANLITFIFSGIWVSDSQSGFRAYSKDAINLINIKTTGYEYCTEVFSEISNHHLKFIEIPIKVIYSDHSKSKGQSVANSINILIKLITNNLTR